jgi:hypothetical protein
VAGLLGGLTRGMVSVAVVGMETDDVARSGIPFKGLEPDDADVDQ